MSQSSVLVGLLAAGFLLFIAARGRLPVYTATLWGPAGVASGGDGGNKNPLDKDGDGFDAKDGAELGSKFAGKVLPFPFNLPFQLAN